VRNRDTRVFLYKYPQQLIYFDPHRDLEFSGQSVIIIELSVINSRRHDWVFTSELMLERSLKTLDVMANHERCSGTFICGSSASIYELFDENARHSDRMMMMGKTCVRWLLLMRCSLLCELLMLGTWVYTQKTSGTATAGRLLKI
jgi:hypothetical protein